MGKELSLRRDDSIANGRVSAEVDSGRAVLAGLPKNATPDEIALASVLLAQKVHPDTEIWRRAFGIMRMNEAIWDVISGQLKPREAVVFAVRVLLRKPCDGSEEVRPSPEEKKTICDFLVRGIERKKIASNNSDPYGSARSALSEALREDPALTGVTKQRISRPGSRSGDKRIKELYAVLDHWKKDGDLPAEDAAVIMAEIQERLAKLKSSSQSSSV